MENSSKSLTASLTSLFKKTSTWYFIALIVLAYVAFKNKDKIKGWFSSAKPTDKDPKELPETNTTTKPPASTAPTAPSGLDYDKVIELKNPMMEGKEEKYLQALLNAELRLRQAIPTTPEYPINTDKSRLALVEDGRVGDKTIERLKTYTGLEKGSLNQIKASGKLFCVTPKAITANILATIWN